MIRCRCFFLLPCALLAAVSCPAQTGASHSAPATPVIHAHSNLVLVDVVVTRKGAAVRGLPKSRFHIFENGAEQTMTVFEEHRADAAPEVSKPPELPPHVYSDYPRFAITSAANVLLLDALNTPLTDQQYARRQMIEYLKKIPPGTRLAVFTLASRLRMIEGFTTDAAAIAAAITHGKGEAQSSALLESPQELDEMGAISESMATVDGGSLQQFLADNASFQTDLRVRMTMEAMQQLGRYLAAIPGRKNLIWFSGSFPLAIDPDATLSDELFPAREYADRIRETGSLLTAARVAVYPVDARGLMGLASADATRNFVGTQPMTVPAGGRGQGGGQPPIAPTQARMQRANSQFMLQTTREHQSMDQIAEETGGHSFYDTNGLAEAVKQAIDNGSNYYTIGYVPDVRAWDGKFRPIEVRVDGERCDLAYRRGYFANDPRKAGPETPGVISPIVAALERGAPPLSQIAFEARVLSAKDPEAKTVKAAPGAAGEVALKTPATRYLVDFSVDPRGLAWTALPNSGAHAELEVAMVAWDADGKRVNYSDHGYAANLSLAESLEAAKRGVPIHQELDLPAGPCYLRLAIQDLSNGRIGSVEIPVLVAKN